MHVRIIALVSTIGAAAACATAPPLAHPEPIVGASPRPVDTNLDAAAQSLAVQGFRIERSNQRGEVVGSKVARLKEVGPDVMCNMPADANPWVVLTVTVSGSARGDASTMRIDGRARVDLPAHSQPAVASHGCVSTGLAEDRVATALGVPRSST